MLLVLLFTCWHQIAFVLSGSVLPVRILEEKLAWPSADSHESQVAPKLLSDLELFFSGRNSTENLRLFNQIIRVPYSEMILLSMESMDDELFTLLMQFSSPAELNSHIYGYPFGTLLSYLCADDDSMRRFKYLPPLVEAGADLTHATRDGSTPLLVAVLNGNTLAIDYILDHLPKALPKPLMQRYLSARNENGVTAFYATIMNGDTRTAHLMLSLGVNPNTESPTRKVFALTRAVEAGTIDLIRHLLSSGADVEALNSNRLDAMSIALQKYRPVAQYEILKQLKNKIAQTNALPELHKIRPADSVHRLHKAMKDGAEEDLIVELLEIELQLGNPAVCTTVDIDGKNIFHVSVQFYYFKVLRRLTMFYRNNNGLNTCYIADIPDRSGNYPSVGIVQDPKWWNSDNKTLEIIFDFLYSMNPDTKSNNLREALRRRSTNIEVLFHAADTIRRRFGSSILRMTEYGDNDYDLLHTARHYDARDVIIKLIFQWLLDSERSEYQKSLATNIYMSAGGPIPRINCYYKRVVHTRVLTIAAHKAPVIIYHLLTTLFIGTTVEEESYRLLLNHYKKPFPPSPYSPLSHVVRCLLHSMTEISSVDLALELLSPNYYYQFLPSHYTTALELIGNSTSTPMLESRQEFPDSDTSGISPHLIQSGTSYPFLGLILPLLGSDRSQIGSELLKKPTNPAAVAYRARKAEILCAILSVPKTRIHPVIKRIDTCVFVLTITILFLTLLFVGCSLYSKNVPNELKNQHFGWIPLDGCTAMTAIFFGLVKSFAVPRFAGRIRFFKTAPLISMAVHTVYSLILTLRFVFTCYCMLELVYIIPHYTEAIRLPGVSMTVIGLMYFLPIANTVIYATMLRFSSRYQSNWLRWLLFGFDSVMESGASGKDEIKWEILMKQLRWKPMGERLQTVLERDKKKHYLKITDSKQLKRQHIRKLWEDSTMWLSLKQRASRQGVLNEKPFRESFEGRLRNTGAEAIRRIPLSVLHLDHSENEPEGDTNRIDHLRSERRWIQTQESIVFQNQVLIECFSQFKITSGHMRDTFVVVTLCLLVVQFPFWRIFETFKLLNFSIYFSNRIFVSYYTRPWLTLIRTFAAATVGWTQLFYLATPLLCAIRFASSYRRISEVVVNKFPLKEFLFNAETNDLNRSSRLLEKSCTKKKARNPKKVAHGCRKTEYIQKRESAKNRSKHSFRVSREIGKPKTFPLYQLQAYLDVRQTIYAQLEYAYRPLHATMYTILICSLICVVWFLIQLLRTIRRWIVVDSALQDAGFLSLLSIALINWFIFVAARANSEATKGLEILKDVYRELEGRPDTEYKQLVTQARFHFQATEFRISLIGVRLESRIVIPVFVASVLLVAVSASIVINARFEKYQLS